MNDGLPSPNRFLRTPSVCFFFFATHRQREERLLVLWYAVFIFFLVNTTDAA
jgi:hypothetical protein